MKAIVSTAFGPPDVLQLKEVAKPSPKDDEILVRVHATSANYGDMVGRNFRDIGPGKFNMPFVFWLMTKLAFAIKRPTILGSEFAGEIETTGRNVKSFKMGDKVFGYLGQDMGAYAEYLAVPEDGCVTGIPSNMSYEEAAVIPMGAIMALHLLREKGEIQSGHKVLINGASGSIGSAAVQIAKQMGAEVTGVCSSRNVELVKSLGADKVIDYTQEDFTQSGESYDLIFDVLGRASFARSKHVLAPNGRHLNASFKIRQLLQMLWTSITGGKKVICALAPGSVQDLIAVKELVEAGKIKAAIDRRFPLEQAAEAHSYIEQGLKKGHIAITVEHD